MQGILSYLRGREFTVEAVPFREKYFPTTFIKYFTLIA